MQLSVSRNGHMSNMAAFTGRVQLVYSIVASILWWCDSRRLCININHYLPMIAGDSKIKCYVLVILLTYSCL